MWAVSTAGHGGVKVSRRLQEKIPARFRLSGGWYEEDVDWAIPFFIFRQVIRKEEAHEAANTLKRNLPEVYRELTGQEVSAKDSPVIAKRQFYAKHRNDWITNAAWGDWHQKVPKGMVGVVATKGGKPGPERWFLVPEDRYKYTYPPGFVGGYVIDLASDVEIPPLQ